MKLSNQGSNIVEHCKWGGHRRSVSIDACVSGWKHKRKCDNEIWFGKKKLFYPIVVRPIVRCT
jgi:hypothetical protein